MFWKMHGDCKTPGIDDNEALKLLEEGLKD